MATLRSLARQLVDDWPSNRIAPPVALLEPGDAAERRRLAAAGRAEKDDELAVGDGEVE